MAVVLINLILLILSICGETFLFSNFHWFNPNFFFLFTVLFVLRWKGPETIYIAMIFGLTADCFSSLPFGIYGLTYFLFAFLIRWYAVKMFEDDLITLPIIVGIMAFINLLFIYFLIELFFDAGWMSFTWIRSILFYQVLPTAVLTIPGYKLFTALETRLVIRLSERKF